MIGVTAIFDNHDDANSLLKVLGDRRLSPNRLHVLTEDAEVSVTVEAEESEYEEMAKLMREHGARDVDVDMTGRDLDSAGRPTLTDPEPPSPHDAG